MTALVRRAAAEALGSAMLVAAVVGSGIMGQKLAGGNVAIALLANTFATGAALVVLIITLGPVSGAHLNPAVTLAAAIRRELRFADVPIYATAQVFGAIVGTVIAHIMFDLPIVSAFTAERAGYPQLISELVATLGLLSVIYFCVQSRSSFTPFAVAAYISSAYWFTASTSFANPAVTIARAFTGTFAGIRAVDVAPFILAQLAAVAIAASMLPRLFPGEERP